MANEDKTLPPGYRMTELGPLPEEWRVVSFNEAVLRTTRVPKVKRSAYQPIGLVPVVDQSQSFIAGYVDEVPPYNGVLPVIVFGDHTRVIKYVDFPFVAGADGTQILLPNKRLFEPLFLYYALLKVEIPSRGYNRHFGLLREQILPLPPLPEQRAIAHVLRAVQEAKEATERVIAALRELKKSLMRYLFTYGPVPLDQAESVPLRNTEIGPIPEHWGVVRLGEVVEKPQYGYTASAIEQPVGPKFLRITDIQNGKVSWSSVPFCAINETELEKYLLKTGDILVARIGATTGKTFLVTECPVAIFASYLIRIRVIPNNLMPDFLWYFTNTQAYWEQINSSKGGRLKQGINIPVLRNLFVPLPPLPEQQQIAAILQAVDRRIQAEEAYARALEGLFKTLLHDLMTARRRLLPEYVAQCATASGGGGKPFASIAHQSTPTGKDMP